MKEIVGNIWDYHAKGHWIVITTNGSIRKDGACVMGRGVALQAACKYPKLPYELGQKLQHGNYVYLFPEYGIITFPVKHRWYERASTHLIGESARQLVNLTDDQMVFMVRPGCDNGGLDWKAVKPILEKYLGDRFVVVERATEAVGRPIRYPHWKFWV